MNARNFFAELKRRDVSESRAHELAGRTKQGTPDRLGVAGSRCPQRDMALVLTTRSENAFHLQLATHNLFMLFR
jgi:hypothetical protein